MIKVNIGCGENKIDGFINIDKREVCNPDILCEIGNESIDMDDSCVDYIWSHNSFEHFDNFISVVEELARISKNGAIWDVSTPYCTSTKYNLVNPYHVNPFFSEDTFRFWDDIYKREQPSFKLKQLDVEFVYNTELWGDNPDEDWEIMRQKYLNVVTEIKVKLRVDK